MALLDFLAAERVVVVDVLVDSAAVVVSDLVSAVFVDAAVVRFPCGFVLGFWAGAASPHCHSGLDHVLVNHRLSWKDDFHGISASVGKMASAGVL